MKQTVFDLEHEDGTRATVHKGDTPVVSEVTARLLLGSDQAEATREKRPAKNAADKRAAARETR